MKSNPSTQTAARRARMLRRFAALLCLTITTLSLVTAGTAVMLRFNWIEKLQIAPLAAASWGITLLLWIGFTFVFGRIYCSVICPVGTMMDIFAHLSRRKLFKRQKQCSRVYHYEPPMNRVRFVWLAFIMIMAATGVMTFLSIVDPMSVFRRIIYGLFGPAVAPIFDLQLVWGTALGIVGAAVTFLAIAVVAAMRGRLLCNSLCPVGTALSVPARYSLYGIDINTDLCVGCNKCVDQCKSQCIDPQSHTVDTSRCVVCFNCTAACPNGAISYTNRRHRLQRPLMVKSEA